MALKIYTKTGDKGQTSLFGGKRVSKDDIQVEAYGMVDELNSFIGLLISKTPVSEITAELTHIQNVLFVAGSILASDPEKKSKYIPDFKTDDISLLETSIDRMDAAVPPLKAFILPGGSESASVCHVARCVCRRAERRCVTLSHHIPVDEAIIKYFNRLSDYLFMLSRYIVHLEGGTEIEWHPS